jgi:molybdopterin-guanine dinucleotide biosynthesis protein A
MTARPDFPAMGPSATVSAAILVGGRARRMHGLDKSSLDVDGLPILERQLAVLRQLSDDLMIVTRRGAPRDGDASSQGKSGPLARPGLRVVSDEISDAGPLGGIHAALVNAHAPVTLVVACDMPFLSLEFLRHLAARVEGVDVAVPRTTDGYHPLCAAYAQTARPFVERQLARGVLKVSALFSTDLRVAELGPAELAGFDPEGRMLSNVNTPHDYRQACSRTLDR